MDWFWSSQNAPHAIGTDAEGWLEGSCLLLGQQGKEMTVDSIWKFLRCCMTFLLVTICLLLAVVLLPVLAGRSRDSRGTEAPAQLAGTAAGGTGKGECPPAGGAGAAE